MRRLSIAACPCPQMVSITRQDNAKGQSMHNLKPFDSITQATEHRDLGLPLHRTTPKSSHELACDVLGSSGSDFTRNERDKRRDGGRGGACSLCGLWLCFFSNKLQCTVCQSACDSPRFCLPLRPFFTLQRVAFCPGAGVSTLNPSGVKSNTEVVEGKARAPTQNQALRPRKHIAPAPPSCCRSADKTAD